MSTQTVQPSVQKVIDAHRAREAAFDAAEAARSAARRKANKKFAAVVRREVGNVEGGMSELARSIGISRQVLHGITRENSA